MANHFSLNITEEEKTQLFTKAINCVAFAFEVDPIDIQAKCRIEPVTQARQALIYILRNRCQTEEGVWAPGATFTFGTIAKYLDLANQSSSYHLNGLAKKQLKESQSFQEKFNLAVSFLCGGEANYQLVVKQLAKASGTVYWYRDEEGVAAKRSNYWRNRWVNHKLSRMEAADREALVKAVSTGQPTTKLLVGFSRLRVTTYFINNLRETLLTK